MGSWLQARRRTEEIHILAKLEGSSESGAVEGNSPQIDRLEDDLYPTAKRYVSKWTC